MSVNFQHLKTFCTVLSENSMTAAARKLFLTQPAISQQIKLLEEQVETPLLVRGVRRVKPTPQGEVLFSYSQRILKLANQAELAIKTVGVGLSGPLRVGTLNSIGLNLLGPVFGMFLKGNSKVRLQLKYESGANLSKMLEKNEIDLLILPDANEEFGIEPRDTEKFPLTKTEMVFVNSGKETSPTTIDLKDINDKPLVMISGQYPGFESFLAKELKKVGVIAKPIFESSNIGTLKKMIETGVGWGFLPLHSVQKQLENYKLKSVKIMGFEYSMQLVCYRSKTKANDPTTELFIKVLIGQKDD